MLSSYDAIIASGRKARCSHNRDAARPLRTILLCGLCLITALSGCATPSGKSNDQKQLKQVASSFHRYLRWGKYDKALEFIDDTERESFRGRYREYEEGFNLVELKIVSVDRSDGEATVEVQQKHYRDDNMIVEDVLIIERWRKTNDTWRLTDRNEEES